jgi:hypothetical protein
MCWVKSYLKITVTCDNFNVFTALIPNISMLVFSIANLKIFFENLLQNACNWLRKCIFDFHIFKSKPHLFFKFCILVSNLGRARQFLEDYCEALFLGDNFKEGIKNIGMLCFLGSIIFKAGNF